MRAARYRDGTVAGDEVALAGGATSRERSSKPLQTRKLAPPSARLAAGGVPERKHNDVWQDDPTLNDSRYRKRPLCEVQPVPNRRSLR